MNENSNQGFKVVDKRAGQSDSFAREETHEKKSMPKKEQEPRQAESKVNRPPLDFSLFIQSLAHQAMIGLGLVAWPDSGLIKSDFNMAKETIDLLGMLKEKTQGNLKEDEQVLIDTILYQLQVAFVEKSNVVTTLNKDDSTIIS